MPEYRKPENEMELNRQLADTIGASVEQLMGNAGWSEANNMLIDQQARGGQPAPEGAGGGEPPAAAPANEPLVTPPAQVAPASLTPEIATQLLGFNPEEYKGADGKYLGKYNSLGEFVKGVGHAMNMTKATLVENDRLSKLLEEARRTPVAPQVMAPQVLTPEAPTRGDALKYSAKLTEVLSSLQDGNLDGERLVQLVDAISEHTTSAARQAAREEQEAREKVAQANKERWDKVDEFMSQKYPESMNFTSEMGLFTKTNPEIAQVVSALIEKDLHEQAMVFAWREFSSVHGIKSAPAPAPFVPAPATPENVVKEIQLTAADQVRREAREAALKDAGILASTAGGVHGVHENANVGPTQGEYDSAADLMRQGHGEKWRSLVFKDILNHPIFGS